MTISNEKETDKKTFYEAKDYLENIDPNQLPLPVEMLIEMMEEVLEVEGYTKDDRAWECPNKYSPPGGPKQLQTDKSFDRAMDGIL